VSFNRVQENAESRELDLVAGVKSITKITK
jgi:hypothetical protein